MTYHAGSDQGVDTNLAVLSHELLGNLQLGELAQIIVSTVLPENFAAQSLGGMGSSKAT